MSLKSVLITAVTILAVVTVIGNVTMLRNIAIPAAPRF